MNLKTLFSSSTLTLVGVIMLDMLNRRAEFFPDVVFPPWALSVIALLLAYLPGVLGLAHKAMTGEAQKPENRTALEVASSARVTTAALVAATPEGSGVSVPSVTAVVETGTKA